MTLPFSLPQSFKIVEALCPQAGGAVSGDYVSLKHAHKCWILLHITQAHVAPMAITVEQASDVTGTGHIPIVNVVPIWSNLDCVASDTLVRRTDAVAYTTDAGQKHKLVIFEIDPALFTLANADCVKVVTAASDVSNLTQAIYLLAMRFQDATPPTAITD